MHRAPSKWLTLMPLKGSPMGPCLSMVLHCAVSFSYIDLLSTTPPKVTYSPVVSWLTLSWSVLCGIYILNILLLPAGTLLISVCNLLVPIMGCAVAVEIGGCSEWRCWLPLEKWCWIVARHFGSNTRAHKQLYGGRYSSSGVCAGLCECESVIMETGDISTWKCWVPLDKWSGSVDRHFGLICNGS